jgi:hypothetical protein
MDQKMLILIIIIFLLSSNFSIMFYNIARNFIYLLLTLIIIKMINPELEDKIKNYLIRFINLDKTVIADTTSNSVTKLKSFIKSSTITN